MEIEVAKRILGEIAGVDQALEKTLQVAKTELKEDEFKAFALQAGELLAQVYERFLRPIYGEHPSLAPEWFGKKYTEEEKIQIREKFEKIRKQMD